MAEYKSNHIKVLTALEAIRKRPAMYIGSLDNRGIFSLLYNILNPIAFNKKSKVYLEYHAHYFILKLENINYNLSQFSTFSLRDKKVADIYVAIGMSYHSKVILKSLENKILLEQQFKQGEPIDNPIKDTQKIDKKDYEVSSITLEFTLAQEIWDKNFMINPNYLLYKIQELALCYKGVTFEFIYPFQNHKQNSIFYYPNGLKDKTDIKVIDCLDKNYLSLYCESQLQNMTLEVSMVLLSNSVDTAYIKSYVNAYETREHGTHLNAVIKGIIEGIEDFLMQKNIADKYKVSKKKILAYSILMVHLRLDTSFYALPIYAGSVRNKLMINSIIEPISRYIKNLIIIELRKDEEKSIEALKIFHHNWD